MTDQEKLQFYMQITAALIRKNGGHVKISGDEFERPASSIMHRNLLQENAIELRVEDYEGRA